MNYNYVLFGIAFIIFGLHTIMSSKIKDGHILATTNFGSNLLIRTTPTIGYILVAINLFKEFYWVYAVLIFLASAGLVPGIVIAVLPSELSNQITSPYPKNILAYIALTSCMVVLLIINLFF